MIPLDVLNQIGARKGVSQKELQVLSRVLAGESLPSISKALRVQQSALQKRLGEVYSKFEIEGAGPGKMTRLQQLLMELYEDYKAQQSQSSEAIAAPRVSTTNADPWIGRTQELKTLETWVTQERCRVLWIVGLGGVGKSALASQLQTRLGHQFQRHYQRHLRKSLLSSPLPASELLKDIMGVKGQESVPPESFIGTLAMRRWLIQLDEVNEVNGVESLNSEYTQLWKQLGEAHHQSCIVLTSWQIPPEIEAWCKATPSVRILELSGLEFSEAEQYLKGLTPSDLDSHLLTEVIHLCGTNPGLLGLIPQAVEQLHKGNWAEFLKDTTQFIQRKVQQTIAAAQLSELETTLLVKLALSSQPLSVESLVQKMGLIDPIDPTEIETPLNHLTDRGWLQSVDPGYHLGQKLQQVITHELLARFLNLLGYTAYVTGEFKSAQQHLEKALYYAPKLSAAIYNLGATCEQLDKLDDAIKCYQLLNPDEDSIPVHAALSSLARLKILEGKLKEAITHLDSLNRRVKEPRLQANVAKNLGWVYLLMQDYQEAETQLQRAISLQSNLAAAHYLLAQVHEAQGHTEKAKEAWAVAWQYDQDQSQKTTRQLPELRIWRLEAMQHLQKLQC